MDCNESFSVLFEQNKVQGIYLLAIKNLLIDKKIITLEDWKDYLAESIEEYYNIIETEIEKFNKETVDKGINVDDYLSFT
jgi:hypothetical protein